MLMWMRDDDLHFLATADNGVPIWTYMCFAAQNDQDLIDLKEFIEAHGGSVIWPREEEARANVAAAKAEAGRQLTETADSGSKSSSGSAPDEGEPDLIPVA